jgi:hypothetical protein
MYFTAQRNPAFSYRPRKVKVSFPRPIVAARKKEVFGKWAEEIVIFWKI